MKNVKFRGIPRQKDKFRGKIPRQKSEFRSSARNSAGRGKLWALIITASYKYTIKRYSNPKFKFHMQAPYWNLRTDLPPCKLQMQTTDASLPQMPTPDANTSWEFQKQTLDAHPCQPQMHTHANPRCTPMPTSDAHCTPMPTPDAHPCQPQMHTHANPRCTPMPTPNAHPCLPQMHIHANPRCCI